MVRINYIVIEGCIRDDYRKIGQVTHRHFTNRTGLARVDRKLGREYWDPAARETENIEIYSSKVKL